MKLQHLRTYYHNAKNRALRENVPFNLVLQDLVDIATDECPIFHTPFVWGISGLGKGRTRPDSPTLDRILPELGYVKGNVAFLSYRANRIKDNGTMQEHYNIADWIWNHIHAKKNTTTPIPAGHYPKSDEHIKHGTIPTSGAWEDNYDANHHRGAVYGEDSDHRAQEGSGDSLAHRNKKVEPSPAFTGGKDNGEPNPKISSVELRGGRLFD